MAGLARRYAGEFVLLGFGLGQGRLWAVADEPDGSDGETPGGERAELTSRVNIPAASPSDDGPGADPALEFRLGAWNVKKLGHGSQKDYALVAEIVDEYFDVVALVEVMQKGGAHPGYEALLEEMGDDWAGLIAESPPPNTAAGSAEWPAILYRSTVAAPCDGTTALTYHSDNDGSGSATGPDLFDREPGFACMVVGEDDGPQMDFVLGVYHARWADGDYDEIAGEVDHVDAVFDSMAVHASGEGYLILAGDFNLVPSRLQDVVDAFDRTAGTGSTLNLAASVRRISTTTC